MSQNVSLRLPDALVTRLDRFARQLGNGTTRSRAGLILIDEALREEEFTGIEFRNTSVGRQPFVKQTGLAVWEVIMIARHYDLDAERTAAYVQYPVEIAQAALNYYEAYREEIDQAVEDNNIGEERLKRLFPHLRVFTVPAQDGEQTS